MYKRTLKVFHSNDAFTGWYVCIRIERQCSKLITIKNYYNIYDAHIMITIYNVLFFFFSKRFSRLKQSRKLLSGKGYSGNSDVRLFFFFY